MLKEVNDEQLTAIYAYMQKDFPEDELKPLFMIRECWHKGLGIILGYYEGNELIGYASLLYSDNKALMLDYLAVIEKYRTQGYGSKLLKELLAYFKDYRFMFVEVDFEKDEQSKRRLDFYYRNGAVKTQVDAYLYFVDYHILVFNLSDDISLYQQLDLVKQVYDSIYPKKAGTKYLQLYKEKERQY